ncbi:pro-sigmaK processing inhibitor BofA family protein, partial [Eubacteriales bacterium OttesenSCG-928-N13]|nr:pro-sigmaK processing inhibitor BofA family protein [Eubacteriales bacterium OttesenSCG-928-N13]
MPIPWELVLSFGLGLVLLYLIGWLLLVPMKFLWRLVAGSLLGGLCLLLINRFGMLFGLNVPINPFTCIAVGLLGVPGAALVVALTY